MIASGQKDQVCSCRKTDYSLIRHESLVTSYISLIWSKKDCVSAVVNSLVLSVYILESSGAVM